MRFVIWLLILFASAIGLAVSLALVWYSIRMLQDSRSAGSLVMKALVFPEWWLFVPVPLGFALLVVATVFLGRRMANTPTPIHKDSRSDT